MTMAWLVFSSWDPTQIYKPERGREGWWEEQREEKAGHKRRRWRSERAVGNSTRQSMTKRKVSRGKGVRDWLSLSLYHRCSCSLWHLQRETERKEEKEGSSSSSEMFFMWRLHQDLTTKKAPCHLQLHGRAHPQSLRSAARTDKRRKHSLQRALLGLDQGDRHLRDPALVTHLLPQIRVFC